MITEKVLPAIAAKYRDAANELIELLEAGKSGDDLGVPAAALLGPAETLLADEYAVVDKLVIPDGFFDALGQPARRLALVGMLMACEDKHGDGTSRV